MRLADADGRLGGLGPQRSRLERSEVGRQLRKRRRSLFELAGRDIDAGVTIDRREEGLRRIDALRRAQKNIAIGPQCIVKKSAQLPLKFALHVDEQVTA